MFRHRTRGRGRLPHATLSLLQAIRKLVVGAPQFRDRRITR